MAEKVYQLNFFPNPIQKQFIQSKAVADLFSSRRGEGKSTGLSWAVFSHTRQNPGARWAIIRDTFQNLQKTTMETFFQWFRPNIFGHYHATKHKFTWFEGVAKGEVHFVGMDNPDDASKFLSWELGGFAMDEPAPALGSKGIAQSVFQMATTCLRQPGMGWYPIKLAENNPDESHWTYRYFVEPGKPGYALYQPATPENLANLPQDYYARMREALAGRPDLIRRFVDGEFGYQQEGVQVTPGWSDRIHLATGLQIVPRIPVYIGWDFGLNPSAIITQMTPLGHWTIIRSFVGQGDVGVTELIEDLVEPWLRDNLKDNPLIHIGDPAGMTREQSSAAQSAVRVIRTKLGGKWRPGVVSFRERLFPLQHVMSRTIRGVGKMLVDRQYAKEVWYALRGGWHYHVAATGTVSEMPQKNIHSHPADALSYLASRLFPMSKVMKEQAARVAEQEQEAVYFGGQRYVAKKPDRKDREDFRFNARPGIMLPAHGEKLILPGVGDGPQKGYFGN